MVVENQPKRSGVRRAEDDLEVNNLKVHGSADIAGSINIPDESVTGAKLAPGAVDLAGDRVTGNLAQARVTNLPASLTALQTEIDAEETARANADATLQGNINAEAALARNADNLTSGTVPAARIPTITKAMVDDAGTWDATEIPSLDASKITTGTFALDRIPEIDATKIAAGAVGSSELADDAVDTNAIQNLAVTAAKIANDTITADKIAAGAVGSSELADNAVDTAALQAGAVTNAKLSGGALYSSLADVFGGGVGSKNEADVTILSDGAVGYIRVANLTVRAGNTLTTGSTGGGHRLVVFVEDTLTLETGAVIHMDHRGGAGGAATDGVAGPSNGNPGNPGAAGMHSSGAGGAGGDAPDGGLTRVGGAGGAARTKADLTNQAYLRLAALLTGNIGLASPLLGLIDTVALPVGSGGSSGGSGGALGLTTSGGGGYGGHGGGFIVIFARNIVRSGNATIRANGENAGNGNNGSSQGGNGAGGGGGGSGGAGGAVLVFYSTISGNGTLTLQANAGTSGTGGSPSGFAGPGADGTASSAGITALVQLV